MLTKLISIFLGVVLGNLITYWVERITRKR